MKGYQFLTKRDGIEYWQKNGIIYQKVNHEVQPLTASDVPMQVIEIQELKMWRWDCADIEPEPRR
jgi:hypothetical protein